ncbi:MAG: hypothetical protein ACREF4_10580 [Gammaproteobacteria bacterium]
MTIHLYHPDLGSEIEAANEKQAAVYRESGWLDAPEPEQKPGYEPEPVKYVPVASKAKRASKSTDS